MKLDHLDGQPDEFLMGYWQAMTDIQSEIAKDMDQAEKQHRSRVGGIFGPTPYHHEKMGRHRALRSLARRVFEASQYAFKALK